MKGSLAAIATEQIVPTHGTSTSPVQRSGPVSLHVKHRGLPGSITEVPPTDTQIARFALPSPSVSNSAQASLVLLPLHFVLVEAPGHGEVETAAGAVQAHLTQVLLARLVVGPLHVDEALRAATARPRARRRTRARPR